MRVRPWFSLLFAVVSLAACSKATSTGPASQVSDLVVLTSTDGLTALDSGNGSVLFTGAATPALADAELLFSTSRAGDRTILDGIDLESGDRATKARLSGDLAIRAVSSDGTMVALMAPLAPGESPWVPQPRAFTDITVANVGAEDVSRYHLEGNFEPEAFSTNGRSLFLIKYAPATAPVAYRVMRLNLADGDVEDVFGREKIPPHDMSGSRLMQIPSSDGTMLFTLYTSQPPEYAKGHDPTQAGAGHPVAFVHTLSMRGGWAHCVGIPGPFSTGDPRDEALAASSDGRWLYLIDTRQRLVAVMDTNRLEVVRSSNVDFARTGYEQTHAAISPDGRTLVVATGTRITRIDTSSLQSEMTWEAPSSVTGLGFSADGRRLYVVTGGEVQVVDPATGDELRTLETPGATGMQYVGPLET